MKKSILFLVMAIICGVLDATAKGEEESPAIVLTLNDGKVINGFLRCSIHQMQQRIIVSESLDGKKTKYKNEEVKSLVVKGASDDGSDETYVPIYTWNSYKKKANKEPILATVFFQGKHVTGYEFPTLFVRSSAPTPSNHFQANSTESPAWNYYYVTDTAKDKIICFWLKNTIKKSKLTKLIEGKKSYIKELRKDFKDYPNVVETVEKENISEQQINEDPELLLEILDKSIQ